MAQADLKKKLTTEYLGIAHRVNRLTDFISSPDYDSLDTEHPTPVPAVPGHVNLSRCSPEETATPGHIRRTGDYLGSTWENQFRVESGIFYYFSLPPCSP